jgi:type I restriction enzyme M protein
MGKNLDLPALEAWLWKAACVIRGPIDAPKFKDYILSLIFLKRLSDVFDDEIENLSAEFGSKETALTLVEEDHALVRFFIPEIARWHAIATRTTNLGEYLTDAVRAIARENPRLSGVVDITDFNATQAGQRIIGDDRLHELIQVLSEYRLGLDDVEPDLFGRAYEYLLRKFAEGQGSSAGEFFTPPEVARLMAKILDPQPGQTVYDPCCGSGGLLIKAHLQLVERYGVQKNGRKVLLREVAPLALFGQEINHSTFAMAKMNAFIHDMEAEIALGDTMDRPAFTQADGSIRRFDLVVANPMWNQKFPVDMYENDPYGRFTRGVPPNSSADWGWIQHMYASLNEGGKMAVVLGTGAVSRGSGSQSSSRERDIRKAFVEADLIEAVFLLPENMFYNTPSPGIIVVINKCKPYPGEILLVNGSEQFSKGRPKNYLADEHVNCMAAAYHDWAEEEDITVIITNDQALGKDCNLSPSRYVANNGGEEMLLPEEALVRLQQAEEERKTADQELDEVLKALGLGGIVRG